MAIRSGQIIHTGDGFLIDRLQSGGISNLSIPEERVYELGNFYSLGIIRDIPDLSFMLESTETSMRTESLLLGLDPAAATSGEQFAFTDSVPLTILSPFRSAKNLYDVIRGAIIPHLSLESVSYRYGLKQNAQQTFTLRGDSVFYIPGTPVEDVFVGDGATKTWNLSQTAIAFVNNTIGETQHIVNVTVYNPDGTFFRMFNGVNFDYVDTTTSITLHTSTAAPVSGARIRVHYGTAASETIAQSANAADGPSSVSPAAIRPKNIDVLLGDGAATPTFDRWTGVQSVELDWKVNLDADQEFGNPLNVSYDYVVPPDVTGTITTKDRDVRALFDKIFQATNVGANRVAGTLSSTPIPMEIRLSHPDTGARLKTIYIPDARFEPPAMQPRVAQKLTTPFKFFSDSGQMYVYDSSPSSVLPGQLPGTTWPVIND